MPFVARIGSHCRRATPGWQKANGGLEPPLRRAGTKAETTVRIQRAALSRTLTDRCGTKTDHWLRDRDIGGGLILGEAVHFLGFLQFLVGAAASSVIAKSTHGISYDTLDESNFVITLAYTDGPLGTILYVSNGDN